MSKFRYTLVQGLIAFAFLVIVGRLAQFQILEGHKHAAAVKKNSQSSVQDVPRGEIVDRNEKVLALDLTRYTLEYNPVICNEDRAQLIARLQSIVNLNKPQLLYRKSSQTLAHNLTKEQANKIRKLNSKLLYVRKVRTRFYPQGKHASHIIGYVDTYSKARQGMEAKYEKQLHEHPEDKLELSIDSRVQVFAERVLEERLRETNASRGTVIVMSVKTGEIVAWAVLPSFDPNRYYDYPFESIKNWSLVDVYQPGSVFKTVTVSSALDSETVDAGYKFVDPGYLEVDKHRIKNHDYVAGKTGSVELGLQQLFERSSNPFAAHLAVKMGPETFYKYIRKFGFAHKTGIELDGESKGILDKWNKWRRLDTATTGIGQGSISVTPLQLLTAVNVIANGGYRVRPTLLKISKVKSEEIETQSVIKPETANLVRDLLAASIETNTKTRFSISGKIPGLAVAGKTGTAQKATAGGGYSHSSTIASFIGFYPAANPKFITLVVIDDPKADGGWGDTVAGPVFNKVASYVRDLYL
jgi:cell division protein FtsI/penicillin-binding protein 2